MLVLSNIRTTSMLWIVLAVTGCGGGGSSGTPAVTFPTTPVITTPDPVEDKVLSGSMTNNPLPAAKATSSYADSKEITIDPTTYSHVGTRLFLTVSRTNMETIFIGEIAADKLFTIPVSLPVADTQVKYQLFTNSATDATYFGEISL